MNCLMSGILRRLVSAVLVLCIVIAGCNTDSSKTRNRNESDSTKGGPDTKLQIAVAYALGGKGDLSYNDAAAKGVQKLRDEGFTVREFEPSTLEDYQKGLDLLSVQNFDLVFCIGFLYDDPVIRVAPAHPKTSFIVLDGRAYQQPNVGSVKFDAEQGSILAGVVAGALTRAGHIAFIGGTDIPIINEFLHGYEFGAKGVDPNIRVSAYYVGTGGAAFTDPARGREAAITAIEKGADVIYHAAGASGNGVIRAASERGLPVIGVDVDQRHLAPSNVVTSMMKNFDVAMSYVVTHLDSLSSTKPVALTLGVAEGAVSLAKLSDSVSLRVGTRLKQVEDSLSSRH